jgi:N,N'-diacetyllegionaminate synthase
MTKIISEIGWNHLGDLELAKEMISESKNNGADFVKFQTWSVSRLKNGPWDVDGRREIYEKAELTLHDHQQLYEFCNTLGIEFFTSVFSIPDAELLSKIQSKYVKIASFESRNHELLKFCNGLFDTIFISTGTSNLDEIRKSVNVIDKSKIVLFHCVSSYPLDYSEANLPRINKLKAICQNVGYSDHTEGIEGSKIALGYDIGYLEKHFTIDQNLSGRDNKFSILPNDLKDLKDYITIIQKMKKDHGSGYLDCEIDSRNIMTGRFDG